MSSFSVWRPDCRPRPSRIEQRLRLALILSVTAALPASHAPWPWLLAAALLHAVLAWRLWHATGGSARLSAFRATPLGWRLTLVDGATTFADIHGPVRDWPGLLCLCFREREEDVPAGGRRRLWRLVLWSDQLPAQDWRRLRVSLRWRRHEPMDVRPPPAPGRARCPSSPDSA